MAKHEHNGALAKNGQGQFFTENFHRAKAELVKGGSDHRPSLHRLLSFIQESQWLPVIAFCFSRMECESRALDCHRLDLTVTNEKQLIQEVFENALLGLADIDKCLPQISAFLPMLLRGVGIHHSGVLPVLREVAEILFSDNLLKVLFATETFAMGVNMPAKTVIFTGLRKFDGLSTRHLESGEYIQMSGRAGRRGADSEGVSILMIDDELSLAKCQEMVQGDSAPLYSSSHLSYNMLLNLLRAESGFKPEDVISRSLFRFIIARFFLGRWLRLKVS